MKKPEGHRGRPDAPRRGPGGESRGDGGAAERRPRPGPPAGGERPRGHSGSERPRGPSGSANPRSGAAPGDGFRRERPRRDEWGHEERAPKHLPGSERDLRDADPEAVVHLKARRSSPHPWIFRSMVETRDLPPALVPGQSVRVVDKDGSPLGKAFWHPTATIALRMLTDDPEEVVDVAFFEKRIREALRFRRETLGLEQVTDGYRIVHAESDGLSGLMVDRLGGVVAAEVFSLGFAKHVDMLKEAIRRALPDVKVIARADERSGGIEGFTLPVRPDDPRASEVTEHGLRFRVDFEAGHKTGFFFDQRDNRAFWGQLVRGLSVLDCHSYTGGFALNAARGGATDVTGVDLDEDAIATAQKNAKLNQLQGTVKFVHADVFPYLRDAQRQEKRFQAISLDPPKLARDKSEVIDALRIYQDLNRVALESLAPNGLFLTCSCSGSVSEEAFLGAVRYAATRARRELQVFRVSGAGADHPVALHAPETRYLKAVFARVK